MIALNGLLNKLEKISENWVFKPEKKGSLSLRLILNTIFCFGHIKVKMVDSKSMKKYWKLSIKLY